MRQQKGFTLIELMIIVLIVAILSTIALQTYSGYMLRAYRSDSQASLLQATQFMDRIRTEQGSYQPGGVSPALPTSLAQSPSNGVARYTIALSGSTPTTYTLTATPTASISAQEVCGNLTIDQSGLKAFTGGGGDQRTCWGN